MGTESWQLFPRIYFGRLLDDPDKLAVQRPESEKPGELLRLLKDQFRAAASAIRQLTPAERGRHALDHVNLSGPILQNEMAW